MSGRADELDVQAAQEILRRAVRLDRSVPAGDGISRAALEAAADELGLQPAALAMALAEAAAGATPRRRLSERLVGPRAITVVRPCVVPAEQATQLAAQWLERAHLLRVSDRRAGLVVGNRRRDPAATAGRAVRSLHGAGGLSKVAEVRAGVGAVAEGSTALCLQADVSDRWAGAAITGSFFAVLGLVAVGVGTAMVSPLLLAASPVALLAGVGVARQAHHDTVRRVGQAVEATAAAVAGGSAPPSAIAGLGRAVRRRSVRTRPGPDA